MSDLKMISDLGADLDPPHRTAPDRLRQRVLAGTTEQSPRRRFILPPVTGRRLVLAGGLAVALTAGVLVTQVVPFGRHAPASGAQAARILGDASRLAAGAPAVPVTGRQFIYVDSMVSAASMSLNSGTGRNVSVVPGQRRVWLSVDGTHDGLLRQRPRSGAQDWTSTVLPGCHDGRTTAKKGGKVYVVPCTPTPGYRTGLPDEPGRMLAHLYRTSKGGNPRDQQAFSTAGDLIREAYLPPAVQAAVLAATSRIPGVTVVGNVVDEAGRPGVAVSIGEVQGSRSELIFDRSTHAYLGERRVMSQSQDGLTAGQVLDSTAVLKVAVVDRAGQLP